MLTPPPPTHRQTHIYSYSSSPKTKQRQKKIFTQWLLWKIFISLHILTKFSVHVFPARLETFKLKDEQLSSYKLWGPNKKVPLLSVTARLQEGPQWPLPPVVHSLAESSLTLSVWPIKHGISRHMSPPRLWTAYGYHLGPLSGVTVSQRSLMSVSHREEPELHANGPHKWAWREVFQL